MSKIEDFQPEFPGQQEDEDILMIFRRHPIAMRKGFYMLLVPFALSALPVLIWPENLAILWVPVIGLSLGLLGFFYFWIGWYFSVFIVSTERLRQVAQKGLFNRSVIDLGLSKIQNMSVDVPGMSASLFGFGTIIIQTYVGDLVLDRLHHPEKIYNQLLEIINTYGDTSEKKIYEEAN